MTRRKCGKQSVVEKLVLVEIFLYIVKMKTKRLSCGKGKRGNDWMTQCWTRTRINDEKRER